MSNLGTNFIYTTDGKTWHQLQTERPMSASDAFRRTKNCRSMWVADAFHRYHKPGKL